jgi:hypothetical protein
MNKTSPAPKRRVVWCHIDVATLDSNHTLTGGGMMEDWDLAPATSAITSTCRSSSRMVDTIEEAEMIEVIGVEMQLS